jgi:BolA family transcriptional regulator, general stress-responsive regulator
MNRKQRIEEIISRHLTPLVLDVINESKNHHVPAGSETHFKLTVVSAYFISLTRIQRHRSINKLLSDELKNGLHALSMHLYTPEEWESSQNTTPASPACRDGYQHG